MPTGFEIGGEGDRKRMSACQERFLFAPVGVSETGGGWRMLYRLLLYRGAVCSRSAMVLGCRDKNGVAQVISGMVIAEPRGCILER